MPTGTPEERIARLESIVLSGLSGNQLALLNTILSNDFITFYSSTEGKMAKISGTDFINQLGSGNITFVTELDEQSQPTGRILIQQGGITQVVIGKVGQSNQYVELDGKPSFATEQYVDTAESDANTYTDNQIALLEFNEFMGYFDVINNIPDLQDATGFTNQEYKIVNTAPQGTVKDFGSGDILLKQDDIIIFDGTNWEIKVNNNQQSVSLATIPSNSLESVRAGTLYDRMDKIFNTSGYRLTNIEVEGVTDINDIGTPSICFLADNTDRYLLIDFSTLNDSLVENLLREDDRIISITTTDLSDLPNNDVVGGIKNQALFSSTEIDSISGVTVPSNYTIYEVTQSFRLLIAPGQLMNVAIDLVIDQSKTFSKTFTFKDEDFTTANDIQLLPTPGDNKIYQVKNVSYSQNLTQAASNTAIFSIIQGLVVVSDTLELDSSGVYYREFPFTVFEGDDGTITGDIINKPLLLRVNQDVLNGLGTVKFYMDIKIISI